MPPRVDCRLGSIFDEECDLLVIPSSTGGTITPGVQQELRKAGIPFPGAMPWGSVTMGEGRFPPFARVAYAATISGQGTTLEIVRKIGAELGLIAASLPRSPFDAIGAQFSHLLRPNTPEALSFITRRSRSPLKISAPLLGAGSGDLEPRDAALALKAGFASTAPETARLIISIRDKEDYEEVAEVLQRAAHTPKREASATPDAGAKGKAQRTQSTQSAAAPAAPAPPPSTRAQPSAAPVPRTQPEPPKPAAGSAPSPSRKGVFVSYSHADAEWLERLQKHLKPLQRDGVEVWDDTRLKAGEQWRNEIRDALAAAKVAILLVSADFLASDFIVTNELPPLLKAAEEDGATILPVIISPCRFTRMDSLSRFQAVNDPAKPLVQMRRAGREKALDQVARAVEDALGR